MVPLKYQDQINLRGGKYRKVRGQGREICGIWGGDLNVILSPKKERNGNLEHEKTARGKYMLTAKKS